LSGDLLRNSSSRECRKLRSDLASRVDRVLKNALLGVYLALNTAARLRYGVGFAELLVCEPRKAMSVLAEYADGSDATAEFVIRAALTAVSCSDDVIEELVKMLREGRYEEFKAALHNAFEEASQ